MPTDSNPHFHLHEFDLALCKEATSNVRRYLYVPTVYKAISKLPRPLVSYLLDGAIPGQLTTTIPNLLLTYEEFSPLADVFSNLPTWEVRHWHPNVPLYGNATLCTGEIRRRLAPSEAELWAAMSNDFKARLACHPHNMTDGLLLIDEWTNSIRKLKVALDDYHHLPHPFGDFPSPFGATSSPRTLTPLGGSQEDVYVERMLRVIHTCEQGAMTPPDSLIKLAGANRSKARKALRELESRGLYNGFSRAVPDRYCR